MHHFYQDSFEDEDDVEDDQVRRFINTEVDATQIATLVNYHKRGIFNLNPPWQRGDVWSPKKKNLL